MLKVYAIQQFRAAFCIIYWTREKFPWWRFQALYLFDFSYRLTRISTLLRHWHSKRMVQNQCWTKIHKDPIGEESFCELKYVKMFFISTYCQIPINYFVLLTDFTYIHLAYCVISNWISQRCLWKSPVTVIWLDKNRFWHVVKFHCRSNKFWRFVF